MTRSSSQIALFATLIALSAGMLLQPRLGADLPAAHVASLKPIEFPAFTVFPEVQRDPRLILPCAEGDSLVLRPIVVTGYTSSVRETDSTPFITASMTRVRPGCLALSRDLLRTFTPEAPFDFGDWVVIPGVGIFIVEDTMNARWRNRADIWFNRRRDAVHWGRRQALIARLPNPLQEGRELFALGPRLP